MVLLNIRNIFKTCFYGLFNYVIISFEICIQNTIFFKHEKSIVNISWLQNNNFK